MQPPRSGGMGLKGSGWIAPLVLWLGICIHALLEGMSMGLQVGLCCWLNPKCTVLSQSAGGHALLHRPRLLVLPHQCACCWSAVQLGCIRWHIPVYDHCLHALWQAVPHCLICK